ncbi:hypothetical protein CSKR_101999 [Clonorchis sinensis]|uniref:Uncharacterized protein n=1 Tax=Clonorchis sinensis TaxID=79923 RepID=A0A419QBF6_CLOSI|nr:hypothetical protein CSKR_101999 [Clonorchis sinensis]
MQMSVFLENSPIWVQVEHKFCEGLTWNPADSPVFDVSRQLNVLHQAATCSSCYDIRDIATHFANQFGFCERPTWNPAESPVFDVSRQLNVLHQAATCSSCYDIRDIATHVAENSSKSAQFGFKQSIRLTETRGLRLIDEPQEGRNRSWHEMDNLQLSTSGAPFSGFMSELVM